LPQLQLQSPALAWEAGLRSAADFSADQRSGADLPRAAGLAVFGVVLDDFFMVGPRKMDFQPMYPPIKQPV
jgi:hypothetical protein